MKRLDVPVGNTALEGYLYGPVKKDIFICCHGFRASAHDKSYTSFAEILSSRGFGVYLFSIPTHHAVNIRKQVEYIRGVVSYFHRTYPVARITLLGASLGAVTASIASIQGKEIQTLVTVNGYFGSYYLRGPMFRVYLGLKIKGLWDRDVRNNLWKFIHDNLRPADIHIPTLVIHSTSDKVVEPAHSKKFYKRLSGKKRLFLYASASADHELTNAKDKEAIASEIAKFLTKVL